MKLDVLKEKLVVLMTGEELLYLQENCKNSNLPIKPEPKDKKKYVYGIRGIASLIDGSISSANRLKKSGIIDEAIIQDGRKIIVESELALELIKKSK